MKQLAVVVLVDPSLDHGEVMYACEDLNEAFQWSEEHQDELPYGTHYDIYYRSEDD